MNKVEANKKAWGLLSEEHYNNFKKEFEEEDYNLNPIIVKELGDISGKKVLHLQCNTGADTIMLAKMGADVIGVDLVPENIYYAKKLADDLGVERVDFIVSDIMELMDNHAGEYDIVFTSDGAIGWLPDLMKCGRTVRYFLKDDGFFYIHEGHPFADLFNREKMAEGILEVEYLYFDQEPEECNEIGGYASDVKEAKNYFWTVTVSKLVNSLAQAGLFIEWMKEHDRCVQGMGGSEVDEEELSYYHHFEGEVPLSYSL